MHTKAGRAPPPACADLSLCLLCLLCVGKAMPVAYVPYRRVPEPVPVCICKVLLRSGWDAEPASHKRILSTCR